MKIEYLPASSLLPEQRVELEVTGGDWAGVYASRIYSVSGKEIAVDAPIRDGIFVPLRPDTPLVVRAVSTKGLLSFDSQVVDRRAGALPTVFIARPQRLMAVQRRAFYRVTARLPVLFDRADAGDLADAGAHAGVLVDLSGGGAALRCGLPLRAGDWLRMRLALGDREGDLLTAAEVLDTETRRARFDTERIARLRFSGLSQRDENRLFQFVRRLERQRLRERRSLWEQMA